MENGTLPKTVNYQSWLREEFVSRCRRNPAYSVRAFAKLLGTDSSSLSQILAGKRNASVKMVTRFAEIIGADPEVRKAIVADAQQRQKRNFRSSPTAGQAAYLELAVDVFAVMADWYHYAILELSRVKGFKSEPRWIARKLNLTAAEVQIAVERLLRLGLLKDDGGCLIATNASLTNAGFVRTSDAMKQLQRNILEKALYAIDNTPQERKDITSMTMAIDEKKLPAAREMITKFRRGLCAFLEDGEPNAVFNLGIQLYPVTENLTENTDE